MNRRKLMEHHIPEAYRESNVPYPENGRITIAVDGWTKRGNEELYGVTVSVAGKEYLHDVIPLKGTSATAANLFELVDASIKNIKKKSIVGIVTDSAPNAQLFRRKFVENYKHVVDIPCIVHVLNIFCKKLLSSSGFKDVISDALRINASFTKSNKLSERLRAVRVDEGNKSYALGTVATTRFATMYCCLQKLVQFEQEVRAVAQSPDIIWGRNGDEKLIGDDVFWMKTKEICTIIKPVYEVLRNFESNKLKMSDSFVFFYYITKHLIRYSSTSPFFSQYFGEICEVCTIIMKKYITKPIILLSTYLDLNYNVKFNKATVEIIKNAYITYVTNFIGNDERYLSLYISQFDQFALDRNSLPKDVWKSNNENRRLVCLVASMLLDVVPHSMSCERSFSIMGWINSPRRSIP